MEINERHINERRNNKLKDAAWIILAGILVVILFAGIGAYFNKISTLTGPFLVEYEGRVLDKSLTINESDTGSFPIHRLYIKNRDGRKLNVIVNANLYERAQIGMWVKSNDGNDAELSWDEPR